MESKSPLHRWFLDHPRSVGENFVEHFGVATRFGAKMVVGGFACILHGFLPALFVRTGSNTVKGLYSEMVSRQPGHRRPAYDQPDWRPEYEI